MTGTDILSLFSAMVLVALIPGPAVFAVVANTISNGFVAAIYMIVGFIVADFIFIALALSGLTALSAMMGAAFVIIKYASALYLIYLGFQMLRVKPVINDTSTFDSNNNVQFQNHCLTGLLLTLGNPKAIIFYVGFFPTFVDLPHITAPDIFIIMSTAAIAFGSVNMGYAWLTIKSKVKLKSSNSGRYAGKIAGSLLISTGLVVAARS
jgi:threonine/homoserine/homoserine lactone efflux protein